MHLLSRWVADMVNKLGALEGCNRFHGRVATISWQIWKGRNDFVFNLVTVNPQGIPTVQMDNPSNQEDAWRAPDKDKFKANCDVAIPVSGQDSKPNAWLAPFTCFHHKLE